MRLTRNQLKELIRQSIKEMDFKNQAAFDAYNKKHKMRKTTKVNVAGKDTTAGAAGEKSKPASNDDSKQTFNVFVDGQEKPMKIKAKDEKSAKHQAHQMIQNNKVKVTAEPAGVGGPAHADVPVKKKKKKPFDPEKPKGEPSDMDTERPADEPEDSMDDLMKQMKQDPPSNASDDYKLYQQGAKKIAGDILRIKAGYLDWSDIANSKEDAIEYLKGELEDYKKGMDKSKTEPDDVGGPAYPNVPKGAKTSKQAKDMKKKEKSDGDIEKQTMKAADDANLKMQKDVTDSAAKDIGYDDVEDLVMGGMSDEIGELMDHDDVYESLPEDLHRPLNNALDFIRDNEQGMNDDDDLASDYRREVIKMIQNPTGYEYGKKNEIKESVNESVKPRRSTIREIKRWMKTLEENRYRKIVQADARRVAWFVNNNLAEDYEQMPKSIVKKWPKAAYKKERYLANEFIKYKKTEQKLRESIRKVIKEQLISEGTRWNVGIEEPNGKITAVYGHYDGYPEYVGKLLKQHYKNPSVIKQLIKLGKSGISTLGKKIGKKHDFNMPYDEKEKLGYTTFYGRDRGQSGNMSTTFNDIAEFGEKFMKSGGAEFGYVWSTKDRKWYMFDYNGRMKTL